MKTLIIIPAYNEEASIERVVKNLLQSNNNLDYVVINDGSKDATAMVCRKLDFNYVSLPVNLGIGGAVQCGYRYALENGYDIAIQLDGDGQHDPAYIKQLIQPIIDDCADMVIGSRFINKKGFQSTFMRRLGISVITIVIRLCCGKRITDATSGFRAIGRELIKLFAEEYAYDYPEPEAIVSAVLNGYRVSEIPVLMSERAKGESSINKLRSIYYMLKVPLALIVYRLSITKSNRQSRGFKLSKP